MRWLASPTHPSLATVSPGLPNALLKAPMAAHARLGPSSADRFMVCTGSVRLIERLAAAGRIDPGKSSGAADEGTAAHQVRGDALEIGLDAYDFVGTSLKINGVDYPCTEEMAAYLQPGIDWVREQPGELIVEHQVTLDRWMPGQFGTLDTAVIDRVGRRLCVSDLKFGQHLVDAEDNRQLRIYALGIIDNFDLFDAIDEVLINIDQPRAGGMKFWRVGLEELLAFGEEVRAAALAVDEPDAPLVASEKGCRYCPVRDDDAGCRAYNRWMLDTLGDAFEDLPDDIETEPTFPDPDLIDPSRRYWIVKHAHLATKWLADLHERSLTAARAGKPDPGSKAVLGQRGDRYFTDTTAAEEILVKALGGDAFQPPNLIGIPAAEKLLAPTKRKAGDPDAWSKLDALIDQPAGKPILVPADDERPALMSQRDEFDDL